MKNCYIFLLLIFICYLGKIFAGVNDPSLLAKTSQGLECPGKDSLHEFYEENDNVFIIDNHGVHWDFRSPEKFTQWVHAWQGTGEKETECHDTGPGCCFFSNQKMKIENPKAEIDSKGKLICRYLVKNRIDREYWFFCIPCNKKEKKIIQRITVSLVPVINGDANDMP